MATAEEIEYYDELYFCRDDYDESTLKKNSFLMYRIFSLEKDACFSGVNSLAFSPDGITICAGLDDKTMRLIKFETREHFMVENPNGEDFTNVIYSPPIWQEKGDIIYSIITNNCNIKSYDVETDHCDDATHEEHRDPTQSYLSMALSTDGQTLCLGDSNGSIILRKTQLSLIDFVNYNDDVIKEDAIQRHDGAVNSLAFSPDPESKFICSGSDDKTVRLWSWSDLVLVLIKTFCGHTDSVTSVVFFPQSLYICSGSKDQTVRLWKMLDGKQVRQYKRYEGEVHCVTFSPKGTLICSARGDFVDLWETQTSRLLHIFKGHTDMVSSVVFSPNGEFICSGSKDSKIVVWTNPRLQVSALNEHRMIKFHPNPDILSPELRQLYFVPRTPETDNNINIIMHFIFQEKGKKFPAHLSSIIRQQGRFTIQDALHLRNAAPEFLLPRGPGGKEPKP